MPRGQHLLPAVTWAAGAATAAKKHPYIAVANPIATEPICLHIECFFKSFFILKNSLSVIFLFMIWISRVTIIWGAE
jgi:hypothetical protein